MRKIIVTTFISMDGVLQAPGGPDEDRSNNFKWGGWTFPYWDDIMNKEMDRFMADPFDLLLGRRTYEIFAAYWPYQKNNPIGDLFNRVNKYVVARKPVDISWEGSSLITGDAIDELKKLKKQDGPRLIVHGSSRLLQSLLSNHLVDELHTWTFPITFGTGKKLFEEGTQAVQWKLTHSATSTTGVIVAGYVPDGEIKTGSFVEGEVSDKEIARRKKLEEEQHLR